MTTPSNPLRVGIGGPVGSGKTALCEMLCKSMRDRYEMAVITNDIYTKEDMEILMRAEALPAERLMGVETGGCPHTAIREDASINLEAIARMSADFPDLDLILVEHAQRAGDLDVHLVTDRLDPRGHLRQQSLVGSAYGRHDAELRRAGLGCLLGGFDQAGDVQPRTAHRGCEKP